MEGGGCGVNDSKPKGRILVVDDNRELADILAEYLTRLGYHAVVAYGGREGLERFKEDNFQIVISDLKMPDMDGLDLLKAIKEIDKDVEVLVITAFSTIDTAVTAIKDGAYDFISKPFEMESLEVIIKRAMERKILRRRLEKYRGIAFALIFSIPAWLILGILLANIF